MSEPIIHGPWSDDEFRCDHALSVPFARRRPLRADLHDAHAGATAALREVDTALEELLRRRQVCLAELGQLRAKLNRRWSNHHVRRHGRVDEPPMPPAPPGAEPLHGTDLREVCVTLLRRHGPLSLRELHGLLHRYGYTVAGVRPVQRLGDAMAYEVRCGRTDRVARGVYVACDEGPRRVGRCPSATPPPGPLVPWAPPTTGAAPPLVDPRAIDDPEHWSGGWCADTAPDGPPCGTDSSLGDDSSTNRSREASAGGERSGGVNDPPGDTGGDGDGPDPALDGGQVADGPPPARWWRRRRPRPAPRPRGGGRRGRRGRRGRGGRRGR